MDYPCGKFGDCSFNCFGSVMQRDIQAHTNAEESLTLMTLVRVSNNFTAQHERHITPAIINVNTLHYIVDTHTSV